MADVPVAAPTGAVYDRGYRPYEGPRGGRAASRSALFRLSVRRALGLRRAWRQKVFPWTLLGIATIPAVVNVGIGYVTRDNPVTDRVAIISFREYVGVSSVLLAFVAVTAPDVICPDRRNRVLPLLFARPLSTADYVVAKVGAIAAILFGFGFIPQLVLFIGNMLVSDSALSYFTGHLSVLWQVPVAVAIQSLFYATIGVALASMTNRRVVGGVLLLGLFLVTSAVAAVLISAQGDRDHSTWMLVNIVALPLHLRDLVFLGHLDPPDPLYGMAGGPALAVIEAAVIVFAGFAWLLHRYRQVEL